MQQTVPVCGCQNGQIKKKKKKTLAKGAINHSLHDLQGADTLKA